MGVAKKGKPAENRFVLSDREINYLKILSLALTSSIYKDKLISGFLYEICNIRFGYAEDVNLQFEIDLENPANELIVRDVPDEMIKAAAKKLTDNPPEQLS